MSLADDEDREIKDTSMYASLPRSLKAEVLVRTRVEDPDVLRQRKELVQSKSVGELAKVSGLADIPIPKVRRGRKKKKVDDDAASEKEGTRCY